MPNFGRTHTQHTHFVGSEQNEKKDKIHIYKAIIGMSVMFTEQYICFIRGHIERTLKQSSCGARNEIHVYLLLLEGMISGLPTNGRPLPAQLSSDVGSECLLLEFERMSIQNKIFGNSNDPNMHHRSGATTLRMLCH